MAEDSYLFEIDRDEFSRLFVQPGLDHLAKLKFHAPDRYHELVVRWQQMRMPRWRDLDAAVERRTKEVERNFRRSKAEAAAPEGAIQIKPAELPAMIRRAEQALIDGKANVYQRDGRLVQMVRFNNVLDEDVTEEIEEPIRRPNNALVIGEVRPRPLQVVLTEVTSWLALSRGAWLPAAAPLNIAQHLIDQAEWRLPVLRGTIEAPTLRASGSVLQRPGYDPRARVFFDDGGVSFPPIPDRPSRDHAIAALGLLKSTIKDFPFVPDDENDPLEESASRSVALSAQLTGLIRRTLETAPLHAFDAPMPGSGKSKLTEIPAVLQTGRVPTLMAQGVSIPEFEKALFSVLRTGDASIVVDNIDRPIESAMLCTVLTSMTYQDRVLGVSEMGTVSTNSLLMANGNNLVFKGDVTDRTVICRIDPRVEDPKARRFDRDPVAYALANRPALVVAGLTVLRAYHVAGHPGAADLKPSRFPDWDRRVRGALVWLGEPDPQSTGAILKTVDPEKDDLRVLMQAWLRLPAAGKWQRCADLLEAAKTDFSDDGLSAAFDRVLHARDTAKALGRYLQRSKGIVLDGWRIESRVDAHDKVTSYRLAKV